MTLRGTDGDRIQVQDHGLCVDAWIYLSFDIISQDRLQDEISMYHGLIKKQQLAMYTD